MSLPKNVVSVDLGNLPRPVALDLLDASAGASVVAYADPNGHTRRTLPYSASDTDSTVVKFYVDADEVWLSAKVNGHEVAGASGTTKYVVTDPHRSDAAPTVQLEWNADRLNQAAPSGGSTQVPVAKTSAYTAANGDVVLANASGANFTVTLPAPASAIAVTVKNVGATGTVTIAPHAAEHIDGAASLVLSSQFESRDLLSDGTDWWVL